MSNANSIMTTREQYAAKIAKLRLMDDDFMRACLRNNIPAVQRILDIILPENPLTVVKVLTQEDFKNLEGHSVSLDILASDTEGKLYNVEIQRSDRGAVRERSRYHVGMIDSHSLGANTDYSKLPETYVIFITENDVLGGGLPIYHIERIVTETGELFRDREHIIYVNGANMDTSTELGKLMADFRAIDPNEMHNPVLADRVRHFKETKEGVGSMCRIMEEIAASAAEHAAWVEFRDVVKNMKADGVPIEEIQKYAKYSNRSTEDVEKALKEIEVN